MPALLGGKVASSKKRQKNQQCLTISSLKQFFTKQKDACFEGIVDAQLGPNLHVWAERVTILHKKRELFAQTVTGSPVVVEDNGVLIFADSFRIDIDTKTGVAKNIRLHMRDGFVKAREACKLSATDWEMKHIEYTACDRAYPEWAIRASRAVFRRGAFIRTYNVRFNIARTAIPLAPQFIIPVQFGTGVKKTSKSGLLLPRFLVDFDYGLGIKQEYYKTLTTQADTTLGVDWHNKKGVVFTDEFRWYRSADDFTRINTHYAVARDRWVYDQRRIYKATTRGFWLKGKHFEQHQNINPFGDVAVLMRTDCGTDKRIEYHFINDTDDVDDSFFNSLELRALTDYKQQSLLFGWNRVYRTRFSPLKSDELQKIIKQIDASAGSPQPVIKKDIEDRAHVGYLPRFEQNTAYIGLGEWLQYRHDIFADYVVFGQQGVERIFVNDSFLQREEDVPWHKTDFLRATYAPQLKCRVPVPYGMLSVCSKPRAQLVGRQKALDYPRKYQFAGSIGSCGGYRAYVTGGAEYVFPYAYRHLKQTDSMFFAQPMLKWDYVPKIHQDHWYSVDRWDIAYPTNSIQVEMNFSLIKSNFNTDLRVWQGYDFVASNNRFVLTRSLKQKNLMPLQYECAVSNDEVAFELGQEYDWPDLQLLQSQLSLHVMMHKLRVKLGYLFQKRELLEQRSYLSTIPHQMHFHIGLPISKRAILVYEGQYYAQQRSSIFFIDGIKPLMHRVRLEYDGHCWGFFVGFEEKKFKECGIGRNERAMVFSLRLDSLGSFAKKFKRNPPLGGLSSV